jgi:hypothetical protein
MIKKGRITISCASCMYESGATYVYTQQGSILLKVFVFLAGLKKV